MSLCFWVGPGCRREGGTLISFPVLVAFGYPGVTASVASAVALWPGHLGGVVGYRAELRGQRRRVTALSAATVAGAVAGCSLLLAVLGMFLRDDLHRVNAVRAALSLVVSTVSVVAFALFGPVEWQAVAVVAPASLAGGFLGTRVARLMPPNVLRGVVVTFGLGVAAVLALR
ncbi:MULTISPECIES: sulfite exporter TauE/SafE family protein [unclassified Nonomuraea]|uniref:sulfite exporter TauE/SafE family protein n=1 Tax=unclassified Nonomuraea TaxID=2593643 RepID=UPI0033EE7B9D